MRDLFGIDSDMQVPAFSEADERVPDLDPSYVFDGDTTLAVAAYNGGEGNVDDWREEAASRGEPFRVSDIPFTETRDYVTRVRDARRSYRAEYARELGV